MAPLRSSRSTRNQDHQVASRNRPGIVDLDPTEGLPVQKWEQIVVRVNQDPSTEQVATANLPSGTTATSSAEWSAQFGTSQFPWPEKPLPSFYSQLPPWNQEMLRRARTGNTNAKLSVWDRKTNSWISAAEAEKRHNPLKSVHLNNLDPSTSSKQNVAPDSPAHDDDEDHDDKSDEEDAENADDDVGPTTTTGLKRRKKYVPEERIFEVKRWVQMPSAVADKTEERKFLADRRPGMPSLYGGTYQNQVFGSMGLNTNGYGFSAANAGYDLGDGGGLGNAGGILQSNDGTATPVRKNMPPKRKKKKGGPGRKKANPDPTPQAGENGDTITGAQKLTTTTDAKPSGDITMAEADNDGSDSGSEGEGSEEGEIDEGGHEKEKTNGHAEEPAVKPEHMVSEEQPHLDPTTKSPKSEAVPLYDEQTTGVHDAVTLDASRPEETPAANTPDDVTMHDAVANEPPSTTKPQSEVIPSIVQPPVSEQIEEPQPVEDLPQPASPIEPIPQTLEPPVAPSSAPLIQEQLLDIPPEPQAAPEPEPPAPIPTQQPEPEEPQPAPANPTLEEPPLPPPATAVPSLEPNPVQPETQLPPITTVVAEAMDQPSTSAPGTEPADPVPIPQPASEPAIAPVVQSTTTQPVVVPEPTSPDLLGGLEDELNKNMDQQNNE